MSGARRKSTKRSAEVLLLVGSLSDLHRAFESGGGGSGKPLREMRGVQRT